ncbi:MAG: hypothetical protein PHR82_09925 [Endomicrobiaceae bacterium]|nr:hypothetical protein [Endomicrobiaceae bacterium]
MGREQNRKIAKIAKSKGVPKSVVELYVNMRLHGSPPQTLKEGDKVKLNISSIKRHPDYPKLTERYHNFIDSHADDIFTVKKDATRKDTSALVCLEEDEDGWLFWTGNLIPIKDGEDNVQSN